MTLYAPALLLDDGELVARFLEAEVQIGRESGIGCCHFLTRHGESLVAMLRGTATDKQRQDVVGELGNVRGVLARKAS